MREEIHAAFYNVARQAASFKTTSRRLRHWNDVPPEAQPALFVTCGDETVEQNANLPPKLVLKAEIYVYVFEADEARTPATQLNAALDALTTAIGGSAAQNYKQTLGGLVSRCFIDGPVLTDEGVLGGQAVAVLTVRFIVP